MITRVRRIQQPCAWQEWPLVYDIGSPLWSLDDRHLSSSQRVPPPYFVSDWKRPTQTRCAPINTHRRVIWIPNRKEANSASGHTLEEVRDEKVRVVVEDTSVKETESQQPRQKVNQL